MKTVIKLDVTEQQRSQIHQQVTGKVSKKLATRVMVTEYVKGLLSGTGNLGSQSGAECEACPAGTSLAESLASTIEPTMPEPYATRYANESEAFKAGWLRKWNER